MTVTGDQQELLAEMQRQTRAIEGIRSMVSIWLGLSVLGAIVLIGYWLQF